MFDFLIVNGRVVDGTGSPWFRGSIGIKTGKIRQIAIVKDEASEIIDAEGLVVCPGFIDAHSHSDFVYLANPSASFKVQQGVTTEVVGNCGFSAAPVPSRKNFFKIFQGYIEQISGGFQDIRWTTFREFLNRQERKGMAANLRVLVGHGNLRITSMGMDDRAPAEREISQMKRLLEEAIQRMTSLPAQRFRLLDRGLIRQGMAADIVIFDPKRIRDRSTYVDPCVPPDGVKYVFVNGQLALRENVALSTSHGRVLVRR